MLLIEWFIMVIYYEALAHMLTQPCTQAHTSHVVNCGVHALEAGSITIGYTLNYTITPPLTPSVNHVVVRNHAACIIGLRLVESLKHRVLFHYYLALILFASFLSYMLFHSLPLSCLADFLPSFFTPLFSSFLSS
jgi:hypothetical protein